MARSIYRIGLALYLDLQLNSKVDCEHILDFRQGFENIVAQEGGRANDKHPHIGRSGSPA
jgi:hypothetical protein